MSLPVATIKKLPPITKQCALVIAARVLTPHGGQFKCYSQKPDSCRIYGINTDQPCWYVYVPWEDGMLALRSSRVIVISRLTGKILFNGSAGDEG
ncbi:hypothetical protein [Candidatus Nitrotoga sp. AM1P]|uniref:hypothetical protein n=1 Tax=Candidatus Nitrotoga sp. AM1P TaxID=2559597 RepID=UPI0015641709|nr:hypothetical protein [Candidatus Nitrotoga sp. AM1P]